MVIKFSQWNATIIVNKKAILSQFLYTNSVSIMAIQETFLKPSINYYIKDYNIIRKDRSTQTHGGGVCFLLHNSLRFQSIDIVSNNCLLEVIGCKVFFSNRTIVYVFINIYIPPNISFSKTNLNILLGNLSLNPQEQLFICGDFNAHHLELGSSRNDRRGVELLEFISENNLVYLNDGSPTFFHSAGSSPLQSFLLSFPLVVFGLASTTNF